MKFSASHYLSLNIEDARKFFFRMWAVKCLTQPIGPECNGFFPLLQLNRILYIWPMYVCLTVSDRVYHISKFIYVSCVRWVGSVEDNFLKQQPNSWAEELNYEALTADFKWFLVSVIYLDYRSWASACFLWSRRQLLICSVMFRTYEKIADLFMRSSNLSDKVYLFRQAIRHFANTGRSSVLGISTSTNYANIKKYFPLPRPGVGYTHDRCERGLTQSGQGKKKWMARCAVFADRI